MQVVKYILQCIYIIVDNPDYNSTFIHPNRNWNWLIPAINYLHIQTIALVFEAISNSPQLWYSGPIQFLDLNIYIQTESKLNPTQVMRLSDPINHSSFFLNRIDEKVYFDLQPQLLKLHICREQ